jgi:hypothetical protein
VRAELFEKGVVLRVYLALLRFGAMRTVYALGEGALRITIPGKPFRHAIRLASGTAAEIEVVDVSDEGLCTFGKVAKSRESCLHFRE